VALLHIIEGARPKKPAFNITRGYTEELWVMTTSCWDEDPTKRPTVDTVLDTLRRAAERWEPKLEEDDSSEESDSPTTPGHADESDAIPPSAPPSPLELSPKSIPTTSLGEGAVHPPGEVQTKPIPSFQAAGTHEVPLDPTPIPQGGRGPNP